MPCGRLLAGGGWRAIRSQSGIRHPSPRGLPNMGMATIASGQEPLVGNVIFSDSSLIRRACHWRSLRARRGVGTNDIYHRSHKKRPAYRRHPFHGPRRGDTGPQACGGWFYSLDQGADRGIIFSRPVRPVADKQKPGFAGDSRRVRGIMACGDAARRTGVGHPVRREFVASGTTCRCSGEFGINTVLEAQPSGRTHLCRGRKYRAATTLPWAGWNQPA